MKGGLCFALMVIMINLIILVTDSHASSNLECAQTAAELQKRLAEKLQSGVPFELLSVTEQNKKPACYRSLQIHRSLWDNKIRITEGEEVLGRYPLSEYASNVCKNLPCNQHLQAGRPALLRVYLNPHWAGRLSRLRARASSMSLILYTLDWDQIGQQNRTESLIIEQEIVP